MPCWFPVSVIYLIRKVPCVLLENAVINETKWKLLVRLQRLFAAVFLQLHENRCHFAFPTFFLLFVLHQRVHQVAAVIGLDVFWNFTLKHRRPSLSPSRENSVFPLITWRTTTSCFITSFLLSAETILNLQHHYSVTVLIINVCYVQHLECTGKYDLSALVLHMCVSCWRSAACYMGEQQCNVLQSLLFEHVCSTDPEKRPLIIPLTHIVELTWVQRLKHAGVHMCDKLQVCVVRRFVPHLTLN